jgi:hypothetical protein
MTELKGANRYDYEVVKLLRLLDTDDTMLQMLDVGLESERPSLERKMHNLGIRFEKFVERFRQKIDIDSLLYQTAPFYSRYYTHEEIMKLIAFFESPLGHKTISKLPQIAQETIVVNQTWLEAMAEITMKDIVSLSLKESINKTYENEINKLFNMMGFNFGAIASQMLEAGIENAQEQNPNFTEADFTELRYVTSHNKAIEILRTQYATVYNRHYSREEIAGLIAFYESPVGCKSVQANPQIDQDIGSAFQDYFNSLRKEVEDELTAEMHNKKSYF